MAVDETPNGTTEVPAAPVTKPTEEKTEKTTLDKDIIRQIEYYFGNINLVKDKFLLEQTKKDDGWVGLDVLVKFNRLKELSTDFDVITSALAKSENNIVVVSDDKKKIRRNPDKPLPVNTGEIKIREEEVKRTIYVKGFPLDSTMNQLVDFFKSYDVESVFMRRLKNEKRSFKGSVFALFTAKEKAEEFMAIPSIKYTSTGVDLQREWRAKYAERKTKEYEEIVKKRQEKKAQRKNEKKEDKEDSTDAKKDVKDEDDKEEEEEFDVESFEKGCLLKLKNLNSKTSWEDIKKTFTPHAEVAYVEFARGLTEAIVRFANADGAKQALEQAKKAEEGADEEPKLKICDSEIEAAFLEGEDEISFWKDFQKRKQQKYKSKNHSRNSRGRGGRGGRGRGGFRGGRRDNRNNRNDRNDRNDRKRPNESENEPPSKERKTAENSDVKSEPKADSSAAEAKSEKVEAKMET